MARYGAIAVDGYFVQQVLMHRSPKNVKSVTQACNLLASEYGVTPETLRCYASIGVPARSKIVKRMLDDYAKIEAANAQEIFKISKMEEELIASIGRVAESFMETGRTLLELQRSIAERERRV